MKAIRISDYGGPEVLEWVNVEYPHPRELRNGEILVRNNAITVNYVDILQREGRHFTPELPFTLGVQAVGDVVAIGPEVTSVSIGDNVGYLAYAVGSYTEEVILPASFVIPILPGVDPIKAASCLVNAMTAQYLVRDCFRVLEGHYVLVHRADRTTASFVCHWAQTTGAIVIGTVPTRAEAEQARRDGCKYVIINQYKNQVARVQQITGGRGVDVVYNGHGVGLIEGSLRCLRRRGTLVCYGVEARPLDFVLLSKLTEKSVFFTMATIENYIVSEEDRRAAGRDLSFRIIYGNLRLPTYKMRLLSEAKQAHTDLENGEREPILLIPDSCGQMLRDRLAEIDEVIRSQFINNVYFDGTNYYRIVEVDD